MPIEVQSSAARTGSALVPDLSVIVPTAGRPEAIVRLLKGLACQTLPAARFEVVVTDDGTQPPVAPRLAGLGLPYRFECEWQPRRGPAAARNRAVAKARAPLLVILNDDAGPPPDLLERHLAAQRGSPAPRAWLGGFDFAPECRTPFAVAITRLGVVFPYDRMRRDGPNPGRFFWTCNLSVPRAAVVEAGGFDEGFDQPICEDVELGYRLEKRGVAVHYLPDAACQHHHRVDVDWFCRRQIELGRGMVKLWRTHRDPELLPWIRSARGDETLLALGIEASASAAGAAYRAIARAIDAVDHAAPRDRAAEVESAATALEPRIRRVNEDALRLGLLAGLRGWSAAQALEWLDSLPALTTLVVPAGRDAASIERLRVRAGAPVEVREIPAARAGGRSLREELLASCGGAQICFVEPGFAGEPQWLRRALQAFRGPARVEFGRFRLVRREELAPAALTR